MAVTRATYGRRRARQAWGMSTLEYTMLIVVAVAALVGMSMYFKRGLEGKWRSVGDTFGFGKQYDPAAK